MVSTSTSKVKQNYAQLDLEAILVDYTLHGFCAYLNGSPHENIIVTGHLSVLSVFSGKRTGSVRTERIKLRHQEICFHLKLEKGRNNPADYLSRHVTQWKSVSKSMREESNDFSELLYSLHITPVLDALRIRETAEHRFNSRR